MIRLVLAAVFLVAGIALLTRGSARSAGGKPVNLRLIGVSSMTVSVLLLASASTYRLDSGEAAVFKTFGTVTGSDASPGIGLETPWQSVVKFDVRNQTITLAGNGNAAGEDGAQVQTVTSDNATVTYDVTIRYSLNPGMLAQIVRQYPDQASFVSRAVLPGVSSVTRDAPTTFTAATIRKSRGPWPCRHRRPGDAPGEVGVTVEQVDRRRPSRSTRRRRRTTTRSRLARQRRGGQGRPADRARQGRDHQDRRPGRVQRRPNHPVRSDLDAGQRGHQRQDGQGRRSRRCRPRSARPAERAGPDEEVHRHAATRRRTATR